MKTGKYYFRKLLLVILLASCSSVYAACESPDHRAFDFWLGDWQVRTQEGKFAGINRVTLEYGGCVIHEHYTTGRGYSGESFNIYDAGRKVWHQSWVDVTGELLLLEGGIRDGKMVLEGQTTGKNGEVTKHRITWTANEDGSVRQFWQLRNAEGEWDTAFDGLYTKK